MHVINREVCYDGGHTNHAKQLQELYIFTGCQSECQFLDGLPFSTLKTLQKGLPDDLSFSVVCFSSSREAASKYSKQNHLGIRLCNAPVERKEPGLHGRGPQTN